MPLAKLLIVDNEGVQMTALCRTLEKEGYAPTGFTSANKALAALREQGFDLVLTDLMMPEMDGITLLRAAQEFDRNLVGILMTGHGAIDTAVEAMKVGALDYILKPFKLSAILPVLSRALEVRRLRIERTELEQRVRKRTIELEAANKELEAFSHSVSHDLRAPLRHVVGFVGMAVKKAGDQLPPSASRDLQTALAAAKQMDQLISDLLILSKTSRADFDATPLNLNELVKEVIRGFAPDTKDRDIEWRIHPLPEVSGDLALLRQVLANLIGNAIKFTRQRQPARIEIGTQPGHTEVIIFVRDNGAGFDMRYAERLFGVFQRLHSSDQFEGTGIGLANVQRILHRHGGRAWAEGVVNEGATFYFALPNARQP